VTAPIPPVRLEYLVSWLVEHRGAFTDEALRDRLLRAGHDADVVDEAFARLHAGEAGPDRPSPDAAPPPDLASLTGPGDTGQPAPTGDPGLRRQQNAFVAFLAGLAAMVGIPVLLLAVGQPGLAGPAAVIAILVVMVSWLATREGGRPGVAKGLGIALLLTVLTPVVVVVGIWGYCLVAGGRVY
jgi:hypothetical protein